MDRVDGATLVDSLDFVITVQYCAVFFYNTSQKERARSKRFPRQPLALSHAEPRPELLNCEEHLKATKYAKVSEMGR